MPKLQNIAQQAGLHGFWKLRKPELIQFLINNKLGNVVKPEKYMKKIKNLKHPCTKSLVKQGFYPGPSLIKKPGYPGS